VGVSLASPGHPDGLPGAPDPAVLPGPGVGVAVDVDEVVAAERLPAGPRAVDGRPRGPGRLVGGPRQCGDGNRQAPTDHPAAPTERRLPNEDLPTQRDLSP